VLRRIFEPKRDTVAGDWGRLHEMLHTLYASSNIIRVNKSRRVRWVGHEPCMDEVRYAYKIPVMKSKVRYHLEDLGIDGKIMLEYSYGNMVGRCGLDSSGSG
jgi:hypothetical protein